MGAALSCPAGTLFDVALSVCNWESLVAQCPQPDPTAAARRRSLLAVGSSASNDGAQYSTALTVGGLALVLAPVAVMVRLAS
eukprot:1952344-Pyramimonas_sp.AAC.1